MVRVGTILTAALLLVTACDGLTGRTTREDHQTKGKQAMDAALTIEERVAIPPIDAEAPQVTETATFALG